MREKAPQFKPQTLLLQLERIFLASNGFAASASSSLALSIMARYQLLVMMELSAWPAE